MQRPIMQPPPEIVVVGSHAPGLFLRVQRVPVAGETVIGWDFQAPMDGGKGSNQAIAAARLGARVAFVGCVGRDHSGDDGERWLLDAGVDTRHLRRSGTTATGIGFILLDSNAVPAMVISMGANAELSQTDVDQALLDMKDARVLLTQFEIAPAVAVHAARRARELGLLAIVNPAPAPDGPVDGLDAADVLVPNETEARTLLGMVPDTRIEFTALAAALREHTQARNVIVTLGEHGVAGAEPLGCWHIAAPSVNAVDTSGAGDVFCAALATGLVRGLTLKAAAEWSCAVASLSVTRPGTIPAFPMAGEVARMTRPKEILADPSDPG